MCVQEIQDLPCHDDTGVTENISSGLLLYSSDIWCLYNTGCGRNNSHILKVNKNQIKRGTQKILLFIKSTYDPIFFPNTFKDNIAQVPAVIDDTLLKPFTEVVHGFAGHRGRNGDDFLSYCLL